MLDDWIDVIRFSKKNSELKDKMLKHVPREADRQRLATVGFRQFELESARHKEYLPLKEYSW